ncbi:hypothetical protein C8Q77DRAFT_1110888 [Trametes polyzona]|nr:hypothetical protein C8Q77DRAFT_1110888 [Trametes polyzona]
MLIVPQRSKLPRGSAECTGSVLIGLVAVAGRSALRTMYGRVIRGIERCMLVYGDDTQ